MNTECQICCESYNSSKRKCIECPNPSCDLKCCKQCARTYLIGTADKPHCMKCKNQWDLDFCNENLNHTFMNNEYKNHRKKLLYDIEKSKMPSTMPLVEDVLSLDAKKEELKEQKKKFEELEVLYWRQKNRLKALKNDISRIKRGDLKKSEDKKIFIKPCPVNNCNGFLSTAYKCGACKTWVCPTCHEVIGLDKNSHHVCNEDSVKTVAMLKKDTKPCPGCGAGIYKISGCDQMFCTKCNIPFSWKTGRKVTGVIHNPHFYEWQKKNGQNLQLPGAVHCGGLPNYWNFRTKLRNVYPSNGVGGIQNKLNVEIYETCAGFHRQVNHFQYVELNRLREKCQALRDNSDLRIKFILKQIDEKKLKSNICRRDKQFSKENDILQIYEVYYNVLLESVNSIYNNPDRKNIKECVQRSINCIDYCNQELIKVAIRYKNTVKIFNIETFALKRHGNYYDKSYYDKKMEAPYTFEWKNAHLL